jgi:hypothetical protein
VAKGGPPWERQGERNGGRGRSRDPVLEPPPWLQRAKRRKKEVKRYRFGFGRDATGGKRDETTNGFGRSERWGRIRNMFLLFK